MTVRATPAGEGYAADGCCVVRGLVPRPVVEHLVGYARVLIDAGRFDVDDQVPGSLRRYGAAGFDAVLEACRPSLAAATGVDLVPTYSFARRYARGQRLAAHRDRPECEHSASIHLGAATAEPWPLRLRTADGSTRAVDLGPGDAVVYRGDRLIHWRDPCPSAWHLQLFLHYVDAAGAHAGRRLDGRAHLGTATAW